jgi:hypothetical protein
MRSWESATDVLGGRTEFQDPMDQLAGKGDGYSLTNG